MRLEVELPDGKHLLTVNPDQTGQPVSRILRQKHHPLNTRCGERDLCAACTIELTKGSIQHVGGEETLVADGEPVLFKSCQFRLDSEEVSVRVPHRALLGYKPQVQSDYRINVSVAGEPLLTGKLGVAIDIGTTTVVVQVVEPESGKVLAKTSAFNKQIQLGDDVLTRINLCTVDKSMLAILHEAVTKQTIVPLVEEAMAQLNEPLERIGAYTISGNTTMLHLLANVDPTPLGFAPFTPVFLEHVIYQAAELGLEPACADVHLLPGAAGYVGADLMSGVLASGLLYEEGPSMLVDVGTNGEIILKHNHTLLGCATAAGPAFEGSGLHSGMRAGDGAISHVKLTNDPFTLTYEVIGDEKPSGMCGTAYVDLLGQGAACGLIGYSGRFDREMIARYPEHFIDTEYGPALLVATAQGGRELILTEPDVASLLQAKAAIAAGILTLLKNVHMEPKDVKTLHLAGGFGMHLDLENTFRCGLLPGFDVKQVQLVGNTSLAGAYLSLLDAGLLDVLSSIGRTMTTIELNLDPDFEDCYIENLMLTE